MLFFFALPAICKTQQNVLIHITMIKKRHLNARISHNNKQIRNKKKQFHIRWTRSCLWAKYILVDINWKSEWKEECVCDITYRTCVFVGWSYSLSASSCECKVEMVQGRKRERVIQHEIGVKSIFYGQKLSVCCCILINSSNVFRKIICYSLHFLPIKMQQKRKYLL